MTISYTYVVTALVILKITLLYGQRVNGKLLNFFIRLVVSANKFNLNIRNILYD